MNISNQIIFPQEIIDSLNNNSVTKSVTKSVPRFVLHNSGEYGQVTENLKNGKSVTRNVYHISKVGVLCDDLTTFVKWEEFNG